MKSMKSRLCLLVIAFTAFTGVAFGDLLGIIPESPSLFFDNTGTTTYNSTTGLFSVDASPIAIRFTLGGIPRFVNTTGDPAEEVLTIRLVVDDAGVLVEGVKGADLFITGEVDADGDTVVDYSGVLLTGEAAEFGFLDTGIATDEYDFRFNVTGGDLADDFFTGMDIGVRLTSETSSFVGSFAADFGGEAKGFVGPIALPPPPPQVGGCTPGYWKQAHHFDSWPSQYDPLLDLFEDVFGRNILGPDASPTLVEALRLKRGGENALIRHATVALLNAASTSFTTSEAFDTPAEVIAAFQAAFDSGDYETTKALFEESNEAGCPLN